MMVGFYLGTKASELVSTCMYGMQVMQIFPSSVKLFRVQLAAVNGLNI